MDGVTVKKEDLVKILKENREKHIKDLRAAIEAYKVSIVGILADKLKDAKADKRVSHTINLNRPTDYTKTYDRVVKMLELHVHDQVELTEAQFIQYVQDDWQWKPGWMDETNSIHDMSNSYGANFR